MNHIIMFKHTNKIHCIMYIYNHIYIYTHYSIYIYMLWHLKLQGNPKVTQPSIQMMVLACRVATSQVGVCNSSPARSASEAAMAGKWPELFVVWIFHLEKTQLQVY